MRIRPQFPRITVAKSGAAYEAVAGLDLKSLLMGNLFRQANAGNGEKPDGHGNGNETDLRSGREGLLRALAAWGGESTLEICLTAYPDFAMRPRGRLRINMFLRASAASRSAAREKAATECLSLLAILKTHMPEAEFTPIVDADELMMSMRPFRAAHAVSVHRRREEIPLSQPYTRRTIGLERGLNTETKEGYILQHIAPWVTSEGGWERFISMMMSQLDPARVILRAKPATLDEEIRLRYAQQIRECEFALSGGASHQVTLKRQVGSLRDIAVRRLAGLRRQAYNLGVFLLSPYPIDRALS